MPQPHELVAALGQYQPLVVKLFPGAQNPEFDAAVADPDVHVAGFEVTHPRVAALIDSNVDPQHSGTPSPGATPAAVEAVLADGYTPPPPGSTLVTVRPDADAFAAMLLAAARGAGLDVSSPEIADGVRRIAEADRSSTQPWRPAADRIVDQGASALASTITPPNIPQDQKFANIAEFLTTGTFAGHNAALQRQLQQREQAEADVAARGGVTIHPTPFGPVAQLESTSFGGMDVGYSHAPVVLATNPEFLPHGADTPVVKHTIARFNAQSSDIDLADLAAKLTAAEHAAGAPDDARWGGQADIIGSPQGLSSQLTAADILNLIDGKQRTVNIRRRPGGRDLGR